MKHLYFENYRIHSNAYKYDKFKFKKEIGKNSFIDVAIYECHKLSNILKVTVEAIFTYV